MEQYMKLLLELSKKASKKGEVPVSAVIVRNGKVISKACNKREKTKNPLMHAEIIAIIKATKKLNTWKLDDCEMYVSLFPCKMCAQVIEESRIKKVYYILENTKVINNKTQYLKIEENMDLKAVLSEFFESKR